MVNEGTPIFEQKVVIIAERRPPVFLRRRRPASGQVSNQRGQFGMPLFQNGRLLLFKSRRLQNCELKSVSFERSEIGN